MKARSEATGLPGRPKNVRRPMRPNASGRPGLHGHLPEIDRADLAQHLLDEVVDADRDAAGGDHEVGHRARLQQLRAQALAHVGHDAQVERLPPACSIEPRSVNGWRRRSDRACAACPARRPRHRWRAAATRGRRWTLTCQRPSDGDQADLLWPQHRAGLDHDRRRPRRPRRAGARWRPWRGWRCGRAPTRSTFSWGRRCRRPRVWARRS